MDIKKIVKLTLNEAVDSYESPYMLALGRTVVTQHYTDPNPTNKFTYGEVTHHNKTHATVRWDDGLVTKHSRATGIEKGANEGHIGRGGYGAAPGTRIATVLNDTREGHANKINEIWHSAQARGNALADHFKRQGLESKVSYDNSYSMGHEGTGAIVDVATHDHNQVARALSSISSDHKVIDHNTFDFHHHDITLPHGKFTASYRSNDRRQNQHEFSAGIAQFANVSGHDMPQPSKVPGWQHNSVRVWVYPRK